jgi:uncharacterized repeat protein (TIGR03803 family)
MKKIICYTLILITTIFYVKAQLPHDPQLYGMTQYGGPDHKGSIFHFTPSTQIVTVDYNFPVKVKGTRPKCDIVSGHNGKYYGTTTKGGANDFGVIFSWDSLTSAYNELYDFTGSDGNDARGGMVLYNGKLYGMTDLGGVNNFGVIYECDITANAYTKKYDMDSTNGKNPDGSLTLVGNTFYGFTHNGGTNDKGVLFEWNPATNVYTKKYDFDGINGANPVGKLVLYNNKFYAMTNTGGTSNQGVIYEWNYNTNTYTKNHDFNGIDGEHPMGFLSMYNNKFYGVTFEGGIYETPSTLDHYGVIFDWNPLSNVFTKHLDLGNNVTYQSSGPLNSMTLKGNVFWGITSYGGFANGAIFSWDPLTNIFSELYLNHSTPISNTGHCEINRHPNGVQAYSNLTLIGNKLLGNTSDYAGANKGCIFEYYPDSNQITRSVHMETTDGAFPRASLTQLGHKLFGVSSMGGQNHAGNIFEWDLTTKPLWTGSP